VEIADVLAGILARPIRFGSYNANHFASRDDQRAPALAHRPAVTARNFGAAMGFHWLENWRPRPWACRSGSQALSLDEYIAGFTQTCSYDP
jgi:hypothetical protein